MLKQQHDRQSALHLELGVNSGPCLFQDLVRDIGRDDLDTPVANALAHLLERHRERIRLLTGGSSRAPYPDATARRPSCHEFRQDAFAKLLERNPVAEEKTRSSSLPRPPGRPTVPNADAAALAPIRRPRLNLPRARPATAGFRRDTACPRQARVPERSRRNLRRYSKSSTLTADFHKTARSRQPKPTIPSRLLPPAAFSSCRGWKRSPTRSPRFAQAPQYLATQSCSPASLPRAIASGETHCLRHPPPQAPQSRARPPLPSPPPDAARSHLQRGCLPPPAGGRSDPCHRCQAAQPRRVGAGGSRSPEREPAELQARRAGEGIIPVPLKRGRTDAHREARVEHFVEALPVYLPEFPTCKRATVRKKHDPKLSSEIPLSGFGAPLARGRQTLGIKMELSLAPRGAGSVRPPGLKATRWHSAVFVAGLPAPIALKRRSRRPDKAGDVAHKCLVVRYSGKPRA